MLKSDIPSKYVAACRLVVDELNGSRRNGELGGDAREGVILTTSF